MLGDFSRALADLEAAHASASKAGNRTRNGKALMALGMLWLSRDYDRPAPFFRDALELAEAIGDRRRVLTASTEWATGK